MFYCSFPLPLEYKLHESKDFYLTCSLWWMLLNSAWHIVGPGSSVEKNLPAMQRTQEMWVQSLGWEDSLEEGMAIHSSIFA